MTDDASGDDGAGASDAPMPMRGADAASGPSANDAPARSDVTVRRSPRYGRFIVLGAGLGAVATFVLTNLFPVDPEVGFGALFGYLLLFGVPLGAAIGGIAAVLLDQVASRRATVLQAERVPESPEDRADNGA